MTTGVAPADEFARETGELTIWRWRAGLLVYLAFAAIEALVEWRVYPTRGSSLAALLVAEVLVGGVALLLARIPLAHPKSAWAVLVPSVTICVIIAIYNTHVDGNMLYGLLIYMIFMLVMAMMIPWGAYFQFALDC